MSSPFNEAKYKALLEGLEATEISYSYVKKSNDVFRFDSNFFQKQFIAEESIIRSKAFKTLKNLEVELKSFGAYSLNNDVAYMNSGIPFIRGVNMKKGRIVFNDMIYIDETANSLLWKSEVKPEMVLLSMSGTIGDVALASKKWKYPINSNQDIAKIDTKGKINPYFLFAFLLSKFGQNYLKREARGSVQQHVFLSQMELFEIPILKPAFYESIEQLILQSDDTLFLSEDLYKQAETILLEALGLKDFQPSTDPINVKGFKESFLSTGRLDAEYYQKKYEEVVNHITEQKYDRLSNIVSIKKSIEPGSDVYTDEGLSFLRVSDYNKFGVNEPEKKLNNRFCVENEELIEKLKPKKETILFSKDGSVGTAYMLRSDADFITSGAILHLKVRHKEQVIPEYLTLALNSKLVQLQAERDAGGSIILHWRVGEIENVVVPIIDYPKQQKIAALVEESYRLKKQSERLLEQAKRCVEMAIEKDEETARNFLVENTNELLYT